MLHTVADQPTFEDYTAAIYNVLPAVDANRSLLASKFCYAFISGKCNKGVDCSFPHVSAEKISACIRAILASGGSLTPIYIPSNVLQQLVTKEEMLQYFQLKNFFNIMTIHASSKCHLLIYSEDKKGRFYSLTFFNHVML